MANSSSNASDGPNTKKAVTRDERERKLREVKIRKEDMNRLVMNFLVTEGFVNAADKFRIESGTQPDIDLATIIYRMEVKRAVQSGNVQEAIEKINDLNPHGLILSLFLAILVPVWMLDCLGSGNGVAMVLQIWVFCCMR